MLHRYINELIEYIFLASNDEVGKQAGDDHSPSADSHKRDHVVSADQQQYGEASLKKNASSQTLTQGTDLSLSSYENARKLSSDASVNSIPNLNHDDALQHRSAEWARVLEAATQRRTEVLMPENLENMWARGRNYKKKAQKLASSGAQSPAAKGLGKSSGLHTKNEEKEVSEASTRMESRALAHTAARPPPDSQQINYPRELDKVASFQGGCEFKNTTGLIDSGNKVKLKRSNSTPDLTVQPNTQIASTSQSVGPIISEFYSTNLAGHKQVTNAKSSSDMVLSNEGQHAPKLKCRVRLFFFL